MWGMGLFGLAAAFLILSLNPVFAQTADPNTGKQVTLSEDLENNPLAQDILKKIEQTKQWIAELEQRNYDELKAKENLEQKRALALEKLNEDLAEWERLWEYYSPRNAFERFVGNIPSESVQGVFWDQFEYHEMKVNAGREAMKKVFASGGSLSEARQAYHQAAETKRIELIEANSMFNVNHNLAYYNQQVLFNAEGQFVETPITGEELRKYYEDYRTNPAYLDANPDDVKSWDEFSETSVDTQCREGYVVVYRFHAIDYVCVTMSTAEMWIRHGMGEIAGNETSTAPNSVNPLTNCNDGFVPAFIIETQKYSCTPEDTAKEWAEQGIIEIHDPEAYIMQSITDKETHKKILDANKKLADLRIELQQKQAELKVEYDKKYKQASEDARKAERQVTIDYQELNLSDKEFTDRLITVRNHYDQLKENILEEKLHQLEALEQEHESKTKDFVESYQFETEFKIVWNSDKSQYEAVKN